MRMHSSCEPQSPEMWQHADYAMLRFVRGETDRVIPTSPSNDSVTEVTHDVDGMSPRNLEAIQSAVTACRNQESAKRLFRLASQGAGVER